MHYHAWLRSGRVFTMSSRSFNDRTVAHKWAARQRAKKADRLVLACESCPATRPSKRRPPRWGAVARRLAVRFGLDAQDLRQALAAELAVEKER